MGIEEIKRLLVEKGYKITGEDRLPNDTGSQIRLSSGQIVNVFDKGTWNVQGKQPEGVRGLLATHYGESGGPTPSAPAKRVFVVYGHDAAAKTQLEAMLLRWGVQPLILDQLPSEGQTVIEKLETCASEVQFAVVLATPDDEGHRAGRTDEKAYRARQNVVLELGMMLALLGRKRVVILLKEQEKMERPSDIQGLIYIPFKDDVKEAALLLAKEMHSQGFGIDLARL